MWLLMSLFGLILINDVILTCFMVEGRQVGGGRKVERMVERDRQNKTMQFQDTEWEKILKFIYFNPFHMLMSELMLREMNLTPQGQPNTKKILSVFFVFLIFIKQVICSCFSLRKKKKKNKKKKPGCLCGSIG